MNKQLLAAASEGDLELVKNLLTQGADKEAKDKVRNLMMMMKMMMMMMTFLL